jgi:hypothetical protein
MDHHPLLQVLVQQPQGHQMDQQQQEAVVALADHHHHQIHRTDHHLEQNWEPQPEKEQPLRVVPAWQEAVVAVVHHQTLRMDQQLVRHWEQSHSLPQVARERSNIQMDQQHFGELEHLLDSLVEKVFPLDHSDYPLLEKVVR